MNARGWSPVNRSYNIFINNHNKRVLITQYSIGTWYCHRNFGPKNFGPGDQNFQWKIGPAVQK